MLSFRLDLQFDLCRVLVELDCEIENTLGSLHNCILLESCLVARSPIP
jgi:hypothetical protein